LAPIAASSLEDVLEHLLRHRDLGQLKRDATTPSEFQGCEERDRRLPTRSQAAGDFNRTHPIGPERVDLSSPCCGPRILLLLHRSPGIQRRECGLLAMAVADLAVADADNAPAADFGALSASMDSTSTDRKGNAPSGPRGDSM